MGRNRAIVRIVAGSLLGLATCLAAVTPAAAQDSSLFSPARARGLTLQNSSWTFEPKPEPRPIQVHDIITVLVDEKSVVISEGELDRRKKANIDAVLEDWVLLRGLKLFPDPQSAGDPAIKGKLDKKYRAEAELETRDSMIFRIAVEVVDIRPNGTLVVEGHRTIRNNDEQWDYSLSGLVRPDDINQQTNTVQSEAVSQLRITKREGGIVRDGYRRGWLQTLLDKYQVF